MEAVPGVPAEVLARPMLTPPLLLMNTSGTEATPEVTAEVTAELYASPKIGPTLLRSPSPLKG